MAGIVTRDLFANRIRAAQAQAKLAQPGAPGTPQAPPAAQQRPPMTVLSRIMGGRG